MPSDCITALTAAGCYKLLFESAPAPSPPAADSGGSSNARLAAILGGVLGGEQSQLRHTCPCCGGQALCGEQALCGAYNPHARGLCAHGRARWLLLARAPLTYAWQRA
jgi:hypothetical protein